MFSSTSINRIHSISTLSFPKSHLPPPSNPPTIIPQFTNLKTSILKPLHLSNSAVNRTVVCNAYEADGRKLDIITIDEQATQRIKIGIYFATWWALNVVFNIYNKKVLNAFPYPWLTSLLSLACGSLMMLVSWVAVAHTIGHVAATVSMSKVAVSFTHIIKSGEPAFSVLVSRLPIIGGCSLAAVTELNFNLIGFMGAMISNMAFVFRNIFSKKGMSASGGKKSSVSGMNYYACLSIMSLLILTPFAVAVEGPQMWAAGWRTAVAEIGPNFAWWVAAQSVFYHLYNQVSYIDCFVDHHLPHADSARECSRSRHCYPRHVYLFAGEAVSP
ncbi:Glucose-6-phosphate/phosphate translocator 2, chloroplastic [Linum grandiflorum]